MKFWINISIYILYIKNFKQNIETNTNPKINRYRKI